MKKDTRAFSSLEYMVLLTFIIGSLIAMGPYIKNAFKGYFRRAGTGFDYNREHHPFRTRDCIWDPRLVTGAGGGEWYSVKCFNHLNEANKCDTSAADNLDYTIWCRANAIDINQCAVGMPGAGLCPTTCCKTRAKHSCFAPCNGMPPP